MPELNLIAWLIRLVLFIPTAFWIWMIIDCAREEEDRSWYFILFFTYVLGAVIYLIVRKIPRIKGEVPAPSFLKKLVNKKKLMELEAAARRIGNPYQFLDWGNALFKVNDYKNALTQYTQAVLKQDSLAEAWWGKAQCESRLKKYEAALASFEKLYTLESEYAYGEATLSYGRLLLEQGKKDKAQSVLEKHMERFRLPEALYLLATIYHEQGKQQQARELLDTLITDVQSAPGYHMRKQKKWMARARILLTRLG